MSTSEKEVIEQHPFEPSTVGTGRQNGVLRRTFQAFVYRDFRLMWFGAFTSTTGTWTQQIAEAWLVLSLTNSAFYLGLTAFLGQLPFILFTLVGGATADRIDRRKLLLASQYVQMTNALILTVLVFTGWIRIWHFLVLVFITGTAQAFGGPAYQALIPGLVDRKDLPNAIALNSIQFNLARVIGPLLAGLLMETVGAVLCFALNGVSFLAVIVTLYLIRSRFVPSKDSGSVLREIGRGISFVKESAALWQLSLLGFVSAFCAIPLMTLLPVFARNVFDVGSMGYSQMMACSGTGAVLGALIFAYMTDMRRRGLFTLYVQFVFAFLMAGFAFSRLLLLSYFLLFLTGISLIALIASINSLVQLATTEEMRGRVLSIFFLSFRGGMPLGNLVAGTLAAQFSPTLALAVNAVLLTGVSGAFLASNSVLKRL